MEDLARLRIPSPGVRDWFRKALASAFAHVEQHQRGQAATLAKRRAEIQNMQDRLLNVVLAGTVGEGVFQARSAWLRGEGTRVEEAIEELGEIGPDRGEAALAVFDWSQNAAEVWRSSNSAVRREILDCLCLNRTLSDVSLCTVKRKPFDILAEGPVCSLSRGDWI